MSREAFGDVVGLAVPDAEDAALGGCLVKIVLWPVPAATVRPHETSRLGSGDEEWTLPPGPSWANPLHVIKPSC